MKHGKNKMALALLIGLAAVIVTLLLLSNPSAQAATPGAPPIRHENVFDRAA
jgi:hypothetical protein